MKPCPFCTSEDIRKRTIVKNRFAFAFPTNIPVVPGHTLISPIRHVATWNDLKPREIKSIFALRKKLGRALKKAFRAEGFNYAWNEGALAGQNVEHFHLHMLPRKRGDGGITKYEPRKFLYRPGSRKPSPEKELIDIAKTIRSRMLE